jgi:hypothetical protein
VVDVAEQDAARGSRGGGRLRRSICLVAEAIRRLISTAKVPEIEIA